MKGIVRQGFAVVLAAVMLVTFLPMASSGGQAYAAKGKKPHLNKNSVTIVQGDTKKLKVKGLEKDAVTGEKPKVKWKSSNPRIAKVDSKGHVTAKRGGKTTIRATVKLSKKKKRTFRCKVNVIRRTDYNAKKVWKYVKKHGKLDDENEGSWTRTIGRNPSITIDSSIGKDKMEFYCNAKAKSYPSYGTVYMDSQIMDGHFNNQVYVEIQQTQNSRDLYTLCGTVSRAYDGGASGIEFTSVLDRNGNAYTGFSQEQLDAHKAAAMQSVARAFRKYNAFTKKKTGFGMKDIGFTKWKK